MQKPEFTLSIKKIPCHIMNADPDFDVLLNGVVISGLRFSGGYYDGTLLSHEGGLVVLRNAELSAWEEECARLNRDARSAIRAFSDTGRSVDHVHETWDPQILRIASKDDERHVSALSFSVAQKIFGGTTAVPWGFCETAVLVGDEAPSSIEALSGWVLTKIKRDAPRTKAFLLAIANGERPVLPEDLRSAIHTRLTQIAQDPDIGTLVSGFLFWFEDAYPETAGEALDRLLDQIQNANIWVDERFHQRAGFEWKHALALEVERKIAILRSERRPGGPWSEPLRDAEASKITIFFSVRFMGLVASCSKMGECSPALKADKDLLDLFVSLSQPE